jgi:hypothetical protein
MPVKAAKKSVTSNDPNKASLRALPPRAAAGMESRGAARQARQPQRDPHQGAPLRKAGSAATDLMPTPRTFPMTKWPTAGNDRTDLPRIVRVLGQ